MVSGFVGTGFDKSRQLVGRMALWTTICLEHLSPDYSS